MTESINHGKELSLIFVNYRSMLSLSQALRSLARDAFFRRSVEVIVVNQDDTEEKAAMALSQQWGFRLISRANLGFASGANAGALMANSEVLAFLNPDIRCYSGSLQDGVRSLRENDRLGIAGATLLGEDGVPEEWSKGRFLDLSLFIRHNLFPRAFCQGNGGIDWVSGGALFIKRDLFQRLGGFDEDFFLYFEDMDLCKRAAKEGHVIRSLESPRFLHLGGKSFSSRREQKRYYADAQRRYFEKHRPFWEQKFLSALRSLKIG